MGDFRLRVKDLHDRDRAGPGSALHDFHAIHMAAGSFGMGLGDAGDLCARLVFQHNAGFDEAASSCPSQDHRFLQRDAIGLVRKDLRAEFGEAVLLHFDEIIDIEIPH